MVEIYLGVLDLRIVSALIGVCLRVEGLDLEFGRIKFVREFIIE